jgi:hypothetical protein
MRFAFRQLLKNPGFTAVAVLTLALGMGAATAVFSLIHAILLNSLPVPNPQELRVLQWTGVDARPRSISGYFKVGGNRAVAECVSPSLFLNVRERCAALADVFAFAPLDDAVVRSRTEAFSADGMVVSDNFFSALGVRPVVGRVFEPGEAGSDAALEVVITFDQWGRLFAHDLAAIGQSLTLNGHNVTIIGVLPPGFTGVRPGNPDSFFVLLTPDSPFQERAVSVADHWWVRLMARMRSDTSNAQLKAALDTVFITEAESVMTQPEMLVQPGGGGLAFDRQTYGKPLLLLLAVVGLVLLVFQLNAGFAGYEDAQLTAFYDRVQTSLKSIPGAQAAALTFVPLLDNKSSSGGFAFRSRPMEPSENPQAYRLVVGETFFETLGIRLLTGRGLSPADTGDTSGAIVVNETFARRYFPDQDPIGHTINTWRSDWRIVGVCADAKYQNIREPVPPTIYISFRQFPPRLGAHFVVRTALPPVALANTVREAVAGIDPGVPVAHVTTQEQLITGTINRERLYAALCTALAGFALVLCCIGLYGLLSFNVARRTSEIGVRMALGAQRGAVARTIVREALVLATMGISLGLPLAWGVSRLIRSQLYGVPHADPATLISVTITLATVAAFSAWLPAWRAARVDPMEALRSE